MKRNTSHIAILTAKFNKAANVMSYWVNRSILEMWLKSRGFTGNFTILIPIMVKHHLIDSNGTEYCIKSNITIDMMNDALMEYRVRRRKYNNNYRQRKLTLKCKEYREFLEKHGFLVIDGISGNSLITEG